MHGTLKLMPLMDLNTSIGRLLELQWKATSTLETLDIKREKDTASAGLTGVEYLAPQAQRKINKGGRNNFALFT